MLSHTGTGEWQSFELRMRRRRAERLVLRGQAATDAGCLDDARTCLAEAQALDPAYPGIAELEKRLAPSEPDTPPAADGHRRNVALALIGSAAAILLAGWAVFPRPHAVQPSAAPATPIQSAQVTPPSPRLSETLPAPNVQPLPAPSAVFAAETAAAAESAAAAVNAAPAPPAVTPAAPARPESTAALARPTERSAAEPPSRPLPPAAEPVRAEPSTPRTSTPATEPAPAPAAVPPPPSAPVAAALPDLTAGAPSITPSAPSVTPSAPPVTRSAPPPPEASQEPAVRSVLSRYASAYSSLDVAAAHRVWPGVNRAALARAFDSLASQRIAFDDCQIDVMGASARARCAGTATWSPKIGGGGLQQEARSWAFELARAGDGWQIVSARVQNR